jgi:type VI secretion system protein ImpF
MTSSLTVLDLLLADRSGRGEIGYAGGDAVRRSIARDLEVLLNCRLRRADLVTAEYPESARSILNFGVPEFDQYGNLSVPAERAELCTTFEDVIGKFEPRLRDVTVKLLDWEGPGNILRYRIEGVIAAGNEIGIFEAGVEPFASTIRVSPGGRP